MASGIECPCAVCRIGASGIRVVDRCRADRFILETATSDKAWLQLRYQLLWKGRLERCSNLDNLAKDWTQPSASSFEC